MLFIFEYLLSVLLILINLLTKVASSYSYLHKSNGSLFSNSKNSLTLNSVEILSRYYSIDA